MKITSYRACERPQAFEELRHIFHLHHKNN